MFAKLITTVQDYSGYKLAGVVLTLLVLVSCSDVMEDYAEQPPTAAGQAAPFQWTRAEDLMTRRMFVRNHGLGYGYNAVKGQYSNWEDIRCQVVDRDGLNSYVKYHGGEEFAHSRLANYVTHSSKFQHSLHDYIASVNLHLNEEVDLGLYQESKRKEQYFVEDGVEETFFFTVNRLSIMGESFLSWAPLLDAVTWGKDPHPELLTPSFRASVEHVAAYGKKDIAVVDSFVNIWGTHVIVDAFLGGELDINLQNYTWRFKDIGFETEMTVEKFLKECNYTAEARQEDGFTWIEQSKLSISAKGGDQSMLTSILGKAKFDGKRDFDLEAVTQWSQSLKYNPDNDMASNVELVDMKVVPIWTFAEAVDREGALYIKNAILQDVDAMQKLLGDNNFYDTSFPIRYDTLRCQVRTDDGNWQTIEAADSEEHPLTVNIVSGERVVAVVSHEKINNNWFWVAYPVYEGVINQRCGLAISDATAMIYDVFCYDGTVLLDPRKKGDEYVYNTSDTFYMNAGKIMLSPQEGITYNPIHPMPYFELAGGVQLDGSYKERAVRPYKVKDKFYVDALKSENNIVGYTFDANLDETTPDGQPMARYRRNDNYHYIYNPNEMRYEE